MITLCAWGVVIAATTSTATSLATAALARVLGAWARRAHPRARAWAWLAVAVAPLLTSMLVVAAVLAPQPWLGLSDHCVPHSHHPHLCPVHGAPSPPVLLVIFGLLWAARAIGLALEQLARALVARRALGTLGAGPELPLPGRLAFTAGWLAPRVYATESVMSAPAWRSILAHEEDHARHRDPLARLVARFALALWPPFVAAWIDRQLVAAQELAADEAAALARGDRLEVARAIVAWAREPRALSLEAIATGFEEGDVEGRVRTLLDPPRYLVGPRAPLAAMAIAAAAIGASVPALHHGVETLLGLLGL